MKVITLRNIPLEVARQLVARAEERGTSASRAVVKILEEYFAVRPTSQADKLHHDLDGLAGAWSAEQAATFDDALGEQRSIDADAWK